MALDKEQYLIETLISNGDLFAKCNNIIKPEYFSLDYTKTIEFILHYSNTYGATPDVNVIEAETQLVLTHRPITRDQFAYIVDAIEAHCKVASFNNALTECIKISEDKNRLAECLTIMEKALDVAIDTDLGINYLENYEQRLRRLAEEQTYLSTGYPELDKLLGGGLVKGQMIVFSGNSGTGKSMTLSNIGLNFMADNKLVLYISLELSEDLIFLRNNGLLNGHDQQEWKYKIEETISTLNTRRDDENYGNMYIKYMNSGSTAADVKSYIKEFEFQHGCLPDVLMLDYLDIAGPIAKISNDNVSLKDKYVSEEFRNLANDFDMYFLTASQQNRGSIGIEEPDQSHIAGGLTKANTSDFWFAIVSNEQMKADGVIKYQCIKARSSDGVGKGALLKWTPGSARITNLDDQSNRSIMDLKSVNRENISQSNGGFDTKLTNLVK